MVPEAGNASGVLSKLVPHSGILSNIVANSSR